VAVPPPPSTRELRNDTSAALAEAPAEVAADAPSPSPDAADAPSASPDAADADPGAASKVPWPFWREPAEDRVRRQPLRYLNWLLTIAVVVLAFFGGRQSSSIPLFSQPAQVSEVPAVPAPLAWSEEDLAQLDRILAADQAGDLDTADQLAKSLKVVAGPLPGLESYLGILVARRQKYADAQSMLNRLVTPTVFGAQLAAIDDAMGFTYTRQRHFSQASQEFKHSTRAEPFAAESFRLWAESLRREGRMPEAIAEFKQALDRYPIGSLECAENREYVEYKIRLSQIEGGLPVDSRKETADRIATADSTGYWFLTDAAAALQQGDDPTAAAALQKAKDSLPGPLFELLLADYFFRNYSTREDLAAFFAAQPNSPVQNLKSRMVYFVDP
jgi:tetratricopeptide (TPR) repeat protein